MSDPCDPGVKRQGATDEVAVAHPIGYEAAYLPAVVPPKQPVNPTFHPNADDWTWPTLESHEGLAS